MEGSNDIENPHIPLVTSMRGVLDSLPPLSSEYCCINRVPERLRCGNAKAYTPQVVSIGPLHHGKESLKAMEEHKNRYLRDFLGRTNVSLEVYVRKIKDQEARLRSCYAETIKFSSDEFVRIILVDAAFIIELLLRFQFCDLRDKNDPLFGKQKMLEDVWPDMKLLENQLPFFILEDLYDPNKTGTELSLIELSYNIFKRDAQLLGSAEEYMTRKCPTKAEHFVDLIRTLYLPLKPQAGRQRRTVGAPSVTELHRAGVKFKVGSTENIFDIQFADGILKIPKLNIEDRTELTIRNLVAFEQCHCMKNYMISDYVFIMDEFVNTSRDVELLVKYGIFDNMLGDNNEVSTLINNLGTGVCMHTDGFNYATLCEDLNKYCRTPMHKWKANLRQNYFNTPWTTVSVIAAVVLLILTVIQTVCSIISVT